MKNSWLEQKICIALKNRLKVMSFYSAMNIENELKDYLELSLKYHSDSRAPYLYDELEAGDLLNELKKKVSIANGFVISNVSAYCYFNALHRDSCSGFKKVPKEILIQLAHIGQYEALRRSLSQFKKEKSFSSQEKKFKILVNQLIEESISLERLIKHHNQRITDLSDNWRNFVKNYCDGQEKSGFLNDFLIFVHPDLNIILLDKELALLEQKLLSDYVHVMDSVIEIAAKEQPYG